MSKDTRIVARVVDWLDANVEEQSLPYEVRLESAKLRDSIETWRHELDDGCYGEHTHPKQYVDDNTSYVPHPKDRDYYDIHDTMDTTKLAKEILNENN